MPGPALPGGEGRHDFGASLADELGDGDDLVAVRAEGFDEDGERVDGGLAVASAVVEKDDGAARPGALVLCSDLAEDAVGDLLRGLAGVLVPVVGVDFVADDDVAEALDTVDGSGLVVGVGFLVDGVRRTEVEGLDAELGGEEALGKVELKVSLAFGDFADVGVSEGVVADLVTFTVDALHDADVLLGFFADHEEGALDVVLLEDVEDLRGPVGIGAVVEGERDLARVIAVLTYGVGERIGGHGLLGDHAVLQGDGFVVVEGDDALAALRLAGDAENVTFAFGVDVVAGLDVAKGGFGVGVERCVPYSPEGVVFLAEAPEGVGLNAEFAGGAHLVENGDGIEEPDVVADVGVLVVVGEVEVEGVVVEVDLGAGVVGFLPGLLSGERDGGEDLFWLRLPALLRSWRNCGGPVVTVASDGADDLFLGDDFEKRLEVVDVPVLRGDGTGFGVGLVLVIVHEQQAVGVVGEELHIEVVVGDGNVDVEAEIAGMEVVVESFDESVEARLGLVGYFFEVE